MDMMGPQRPGFAVVDVETTGFDPGDDRIVEVAVVVLAADGAELDTFCTLVDPDRDPGPTHVHGISAEMVTGAPPFSAVHPYLAGLLSGRVVVGHNVDRFDLAFLRAECRRLGGAGLVPGPLASIDTLEVAQRFLPLPGKARLVDCCDHFGLQWDDHHSALGDAQVTADLFAAMRQEVGEGRLEVDQRLRLARVSRWPGGSDLRPATYGRAAAPTG